uniref:Uncharacterized protein n=1 Tax=Arion vulgaris TaxID=1028688 RepID=A0A0B7AIW7_9EUPU
MYYNQFSPSDITCINIVMTDSLQNIGTTLTVWWHLENGNCITNMDSKQTHRKISGGHRDVILQTNIRISSISLIYKTNEKALNEVNAEGKL